MLKVKHDEQNDSFRGAGFFTISDDINNSLWVWYSRLEKNKSKSKRTAHTAHTAHAAHAAHATHVEALVGIIVILVLPLVPVALQERQLGAILALVPPALVLLLQAERDEAVVRHLRLVLDDLREERQLHRVGLLLLARARQLEHLLTQFVLQVLRTDDIDSQEDLLARPISIVGRKNF